MATVVTIALGVTANDLSETLWKVAWNAGTHNNSTLS